MGWDVASSETFAGRVRAAARELGEGEKEFSAADLSHAVGIQTFDENRKLHWTLRDLKRSGELIRDGRGVYRLTGKPGKAARATGRSSKSLPLREIMWRFLRMRKVVTVGDLQEASGATEEYIKEWLRMLNRRGVVKKLKGCRWQLTATELIEAPHDTEKAEKLRRLRARRKANLIAIIDDAQMRLQEAAQRLDEARGELVASD